MSSDIEKCLDPELGKLLAAYELGLLDSAQRRRFEDHLKECSACQEALVELAPYVAALQQEPGRYAAQLAAARPSASSSPPSAARDGLRRLGQWLGWGSPWRVLVPAVAAAAILLVLLPLHRQPGLPSLARLESVDYVPLETRAAGLGEGERLFREAMRDYADESYLDAAQRLAIALDLPADESGLRDRNQAAFFAGLSFLLAGKPDSARGYLTAAREARLPVLADRARWYLAQACLLGADLPCARENLKSLIASPAYGSAAREQLAALPAPAGGDR